MFEFKRWKPYMSIWVYIYGFFVYRKPRENKISKIIKEDIFMSKKVVVGIAIVLVIVAIIIVVAFGNNPEENQRQDI